MGGENATGRWLGDEFVADAVDGEKVLGFAAVVAEFFAKLSAKRRRDKFPGMSTVAEIESAVEKLPLDKLAEFAAWFEDYQSMVNASAEIFTMYDREEEK